MKTQIEVYADLGQDDEYTENFVHMYRTICSVIESYGYKVLDEEDKSDQFEAVNNTLYNKR